MADKKQRFQKQKLNSDDHKGIENGAKALKGIAGVAAAAAAVFVNKENLKTLGKETLKFIQKAAKL